MRVQTLSIIAGSEACNARCPFCVSKMTPSCGLDELKEPEVNWRNFRKACLLAKQSGVTTAMLTGKGEPTLFPGQISRYLKELMRYEFPLIEIQTNGIMLAQQPKKYDEKKRVEIVAFACTKAPEGRKRWTVRLLAEELSKQKGFETVNRETIRLVLKKTKLNLG